MKTRLGLIALILVGLSAPALADKRSDAKSQVAWGVTLAQKNLWKDATLQWESAAAMDPSYSSAWNNLGIGYEQLGRFDDARKSYEKAMELDPKSTYIKDNYDRFREIYDRQNRRRDK